MTLLSTISNESINENLKKRFENKEIYVRQLIRYLMAKACRLIKLIACRLPCITYYRQTYIAHVLISVNPFRGQSPASISAHYLRAGQLI